MVRLEPESPGVDDRPSSGMAAWLRRHATAIAEAWVDDLRAVPGTGYAERSHEEVRGWALGNLEVLAAASDSGSPAPLQAHAEEMARVRLSLGFGLGEVIQGLLRLPAAARPRLAADPPESPEALDDLLRDLTGRFATTFADEGRRSMEDERNRTRQWLEETRRQLGESRSLHAVVLAMLDKVGASAVASIVGPSVQDLTGARGVAVLLRRDDATSECVLMRGVPSSRAPLLEALAPDRSETAPRVDPAVRLEENAETVSLLTVPLRSRSRVLGAILLLDKPGGFGPEDVRVAKLFADQAAVAIEHEQLRDESERMAILEERQKLARELHDSVTQSIYGVTMYAEAAARLLDAGSTEKAADTLREIRESALDALREMRLFIYELRPRTVADVGLAAAIESRLASVEGRAGLRTSFVGSGVGTLPRDVEEALHGVAREALNNVLKHADATTISVTLRPEGAGVELEITDDGGGFDVATTRLAGGLGLAGMEDRATQVGGRLTVTSGPSGTVLRARIPLS